MWIHRAYRSLPALGEQGIRWSPAWAAGGWFVPFANLVIPYQIMWDLWSRFGDERPLPQLWWAGCIAGIVIEFIGAELLPVNPRLGEVVDILFPLVQIGAGLVLLAMIRLITRRQRERQAQVRRR